MKILSWNVNGLKKNWSTLLQLMAVELPELVCIQNYRAHNYTFPYSIDLGLPRDEVIPSGETWACNYTRISARTSLSNGVAVFSRWAFAQNYSTYGKIDANNKPVPDTNWVYQKHAGIYASGRLLAFDFQYFTLCTVLPPSDVKDPKSKHWGTRKRFDDDLLHFLVDLQKETPVVVTGDFKIAAEDRDIHPFLLPAVAKPKLIRGNPSIYTNNPSAAYVAQRIDPVLRQQFAAYRLAGFYDALRLFNNQTDLYTCWSSRKPKDTVEQPFSNRQLNKGWRSDYFLVNRALKDRVQSCTVLSDIMGSRNAPIKLVLDLPDPDNPPPPPPLPLDEVPNQPVLDWDGTYLAGETGNVYFA